MVRQAHGQVPLTEPVFQIVITSYSIHYTKLYEFKEEHFDLILMDVHMPGMDGVEATQEIRRIEKESGIGEGIPIIAMTANKFNDEVKLFLKSGMNDHLGKPFKPTELDAVIKKNLNLKEV